MAPRAQTTPTTFPPLPAASEGTANLHQEQWQRLSVKPGQLMKLTVSINDTFRAGDIVCLSKKLRPVYNSPGGNHPGNQEPINADTTVYFRAYKWVKTVEKTNIETLEGKGNLIPHQFLKPLVAGRAPTRWDIDARVVLTSTAHSSVSQFSTKRRPERGHPSYRLRDGLVGAVADCKTLGGSASNGKAYKDWAYKLKLTGNETKYQWIICIQELSISVLKPLTNEEAQNEIRRIRQTLATHPTPQYELVSFENVAEEYIAVIPE